MEFARVLRLSALFLPLTMMGCRESTESPAAARTAAPTTTPTAAATAVSEPPSHNDVGRALGELASAAGAVTIVWQPPSRNEDGSALDDLAGFRIRYGATAEQLTTEVVVENPDATKYLLEGLMPGPYYFIVSAIDYEGHEGPYSDPERILVN